MKDVFIRLFLASALASWVLHGVALQLGTYPFPKYGSTLDRSTVSS